MTKKLIQIRKFMRVHTCTKIILGSVLATAISLRSWTIKITGAQPLPITPAPSKSVAHPSFVTSKALPNGTRAIDQSKLEIEIAHKFDVSVPSDSQRIIDALPTDKKLLFRNSISALSSGVSGVKLDQAVKEIRKNCLACTVVPRPSNDATSATKLIIRPLKPNPLCNAGERYDVYLEKCVAY